MWRVVLLFCLISFVVVPIVIQQVNQRPDSHVAAAMVAHAAEIQPKEGPDRRMMFVADGSESMAQVSHADNMSVISINPFRRKIMADVSFNTVNSSNHSNNSSAILPPANITTVDQGTVAQVPVTRVKDLKPPPPASTTTIATPSATTAIPANTSQATPTTTGSSLATATTAATSAPTTKTTATATTATTTTARPSDPEESKRRKALLSRFILDSKQGLNASSPECQQQLDRTDACFRTVMLVDEKFMVPKTFAELDSTFCANHTAMLRCLGGYSKCLNKIPRILYHFLYLQVKRILNDVCRVESFREDVLFHARCFQPGDLRMVREIVDRGTITSLYVLRHVATVNIIPWGTCISFDLISLSN